MDGGGASAAAGRRSSSEQAGGASGGGSKDAVPSSWAPQAGTDADDVDTAGIGVDGRLDTNVTNPQKENDGTKDAYVSYLVTTDTNIKQFQSSTFTVRRRFTDFVFLFKMLSKEYPALLVPPVPEKHNMQYVRGDRFGNEFTARRAASLSRFLKRLTLHPVFRRSTILVLFLESADWHATMRSRETKITSADAAAGGGTGVFDNLTDTFMNAFSKSHKPDKRFLEVRDRATRLDEDLGHVEKCVGRVVRRQAELEADYSDLQTQTQKLVTLEPGVEGPLTQFAACVGDTAAGWRKIKEHTDQNYLTSLRDMEAYTAAIRALLKSRDQRQLDFEALTDYLTKAANERDMLASGGGSGGASGFLRSKIEDARGVDHEQSRRDRLRKTEMQIDRLTREVDNAKATSEMFDEQVMKEVADFERIKAIEFRDTLGELAVANCQFYAESISVWERFITDMEKEERESARQRSGST